MLFDGIQRAAGPRTGGGHALTPRIFNLPVSDLAGPRHLPYLDGAPVQAIYPMLPLAQDAALTSVVTATPTTSISVWPVRAMRCRICSAWRSTWRRRCRIWKQHWSWGSDMVD